MGKFLSVVTRCNNRPQALYANIESLATQTDKDYDQTLIVDGKSRGIPWANAQLGKQAQKANGDYILVLDDDDAMADDHAIALLKIVADEHDKPELILFRMDHGKNILPDEHVWKKHPVSGRIGMSSWIVRSDIWRLYAGEWVEDTEADYQWLTAIWDKTPEKVWVDCVLTKCQNGRSWGSTE